MLSLLVPYSMSQRSAIVPSRVNRETRIVTRAQALNLRAPGLFKTPTTSDLDRHQILMFIDLIRRHPVCRFLLCRHSR
ncbi:MAG: hypothetical protein ACRD3J_07820, partial [Thermoanaerobaculia bacterium]